MWAVIINDNQLVNLQLGFVSRYIHVIVSITFVELRQRKRALSEAKLMYQSRPNLPSGEFLLITWEYGKAMGNNVESLILFRSCIRRNNIIFTGCVCFLCSSFAVFPRTLINLNFNAGVLRNAFQSLVDSLTGT